jgi:hypothetical protein
MKFVCWLWRGSGFWKETARYDEEHPCVLASMLKRHGGHELLCVQDGSFDIPGSVVMPEEVRQLPDYLPKLWAFSPEFHAIVGARFASIDLDVVVTGDLEPLLTDDFRIWDSAVGEPYNSSLFVLEPGKHQEIWTSLSPERLGKAKRRASRWTGDQSWIAHALGPSQPTFSEEQGVIRYRPRLHRDEPKGVKAVFFCGPYCPRGELENAEWIERQWR